MKLKYLGTYLIFFFTVISIVSFWVVDPISQVESYHQFCDSKMIGGIPNFWNVISNLPFLVVGVWGLLAFRYMHNNRPYQLLFLAIALVFFGSSYYHWNPTSQTLVWDRLPMTVAFMTLFSIIISEFVNEKFGQLILIPAILMGLLSVGYWVVYDDLRFYLLVQLLPMVAICILLLFFKSNYTHYRGYWMLLLAYVLAKIVAYYDCDTMEFTHVVGGHPIKHILAAMGVVALLFSYLKRSKIES